MKQYILKVAKELEQGNITEDKARSLLLHLFGVKGYLQPLTLQRVEKMIKDASLCAFIAGGGNESKWEEWWSKENSININSNKEML